MTRHLIPALLLCSAACGEAPPAAVAASVRIDALLTADTKSLTLYVLGEHRSDGVELTCGNLVDKLIEPDDPRVDGLARTTINFSNPGKSIELTAVAAGGNRLVYGDAISDVGTVIGNGCTEFITVSAGGTTSIQLEIYPM